MQYGIPRATAVVHVNGIRTIRRQRLGGSILTGELGSGRGALAACWLPHQVEPVLSVLAPYGHGQLSIRFHLSWAAGQWSFPKAISLCSALCESIPTQSPGGARCNLLPALCADGRQPPACFLGFFCLLAHDYYLQCASQFPVCGTPTSSPIRTFALTHILDCQFVLGSFSHP